MMLFPAILLWVVPQWLFKAKEKIPLVIIFHLECVCTEYTMSRFFYPFFSKNTIMCSSIFAGVGSSVVNTRVKNSFRSWLRHLNDSNRSS